MRLFEHDRKLGMQGLNDIGLINDAIVMIQKVNESACYWKWFFQGKSTTLQI